MKMHYLIAGHTGLIGSFLLDYLEKAGHRCTTLGRSEQSDITWDSLEQHEATLLEVDHIIHLAGANILAKKWTRAYKKNLVSSRVDTLEALYQFYVSRFNYKLQSIVCTSAIGYYATSVDTPAVETEGVDAHFVAQICNKVEEKAHHFTNLGIRTTVFRLGVVLSNQGGLLPKLLPSFRKGFGSSIGSGQQLLSWVTEHDVIRAYEYVTVGNTEIQGTYNLVGGNTPYKAFASNLAQSIGKKMWMPSVPSFIIRLSMSGRSKLLLEGRDISNQKLKDDGFAFKHERIDLALYDTLGEES